MEQLTFPPKVKVFAGSGEPRDMRTAVGRTSQKIEQWGGDYWIQTPFHKAIVQRKTTRDFALSLNNGQLATELSRIQKYKIKYLIIEGKWQWWYDEKAVFYGRRGRKIFGPTRTRVRRSVLSIELHDGVEVLESDSKEETLRWVQDLAYYLSKSKHTGLRVRPKVREVDDWDQVVRVDQGVGVLQGFKGVGVTIAENILKLRDGKLPLQWTVSQKELESVPRVGKGLAQRLYSELNDEAST